MPRVRPLTSVEREMQADEEALKIASREFMEILGAERGRKDMTHESFSDHIGVTRQTYYNWRKAGIGGMSVKSLVRICRKVGAQVQIVPVHGNPR